jgi:hypothetical protein
MAKACIAATGEWRGDDGIRMPAGAVHGWLPGQNQTVCGLPLSRAGLRVFPHLPWDYRDTDVLGPSDRVAYVCEGCLAALRDRPRRGQHKGWTRRSPRP